MYERTSIKQEKAAGQTISHGRVFSEEASANHLKENIAIKKEDKHSSHNGPVDPLQNMEFSGLL